MDRKPLAFIRRGNSVRAKEKRSNRDEEGGALSRWLRELRGEAKSPQPAPAPERANPAYHSEGKGLRSRKQGRRRHSFQHHHRCCGGEDGGGKRGPAMTGETTIANTSPYILNTSPTLKAVMEREKFLPGVDREGKVLGEPDYTIPSPPERDLSHLDTFTKYTETRLSQLSIDGGYDGSQSSLTRAELEQYSRAYEEVRAPSHSQQPSYAQSEGYHSYVSSADSTIATPFLDRLRRENETGRESSASSGSSSETLKWHGSLSDVSSTPQHIAHSARVPMPQRHHSESVLYLEPWPQHVNNMRRLYPVSTYEPTAPRYILSNDRSPPKLSVAERICEIERRGGDHDKRRPVTDHASLKAIQKKALLSFYERHASAWKSEPQLTAPSIPPQPPPRPPPQASRRSSSASDYAGAMKREVPRSSIDSSKVEHNNIRDSKHQHSSSCGSLTSSTLGPMIIGPSICVDDWVPARPPKKPHLRAAYPPPPRPSSPEHVTRPEPSYPHMRPPSPEPPPPSPPPPPEAESYPDDPLPPPPPEIQRVSEVQPGYTRRYERAMNASLSLDNLTRSEKPSLLVSKSHDISTDVYYENGTELKRNEHNKNGFSYVDKFNERFVENRIESMQNNYCDPLTEFRDKKNYLDMRRYGEKKQPEAQVRTNLLSPPIPNKKRSHSEQPRSLDSNLSIVETNNEVNKPGPQTPTNKKYSSPLSINGHEKHNYKNLRDNFLRSNSVQNDVQLMKNVPERQSLRFTTATQKLLVNGKIANAIHNGKISPPSRKANLVRTPSDVVRKVSGIHHAEPLEKHSESMVKHPDPLKKHADPVIRHSDSVMRLADPMVKHDSVQKPALPPHCPPTTLQLSQSKASYLSYRGKEAKDKEKGLPNFQGSYKRTMSPSGGRIIETAIEKPIEKVPPANNEEKILQKEESMSKDEEKEVIKRENSPHLNQERDLSDKEASSKTLPRGYPVAGPAKTRSRAPRAQSDPTCSAKVEKKTVSASTQDNLDEIVREDKIIVVGRSQSDRTETRRAEEPRVSDASSQTTPTPSPPPTPPRRHFQEEIECDQLSRDLASQLSPSHKLHGILVPGPEVKRSTDYVSGLFRMDFMPRSRSSLVTPSSTSTVVTSSTTQSSSQTITTQETSITKPAGNENDSQSMNNTFITTSECKARLLPSTTSTTTTTTATTNNNINVTSNDSPSPSSIGSLQQKKEELMMRLTRKLSVLRAESVAVTEETAVNESLGTAVSERVERVARPHEVSRFKLHVMEVGHITSLLLSLSGRLARAENALLSLSPEHHDRKVLEEKRDKLLCQLNEAKQLKSNIDQRSGSVSSMLYNYLTGEEYTDYDHFINMKSKLLVDSREIAEKIQLGEEQLSALKETLDQVR